MMAKVNANPDAKPAAVAMLTPKSSATCGKTGSRARAERLAAKVASAMMFRIGGMLSAPRPPLRMPASTRRALGKRVECHQSPHQTLELIQRHHVGTIGRCLVGIGMGFDEYASDPDRHRGACQHRHELTLAAG